MLTPETTEAFFDRGYVIVHDVFAGDEIAEMRAAFDRLEAIAHRLRQTCMYGGSKFVLDTTSGPDGNPHTRIHRIVWCGAVEPVLARYGSDSRLTKAAARLLGSTEMNQLINQAHFKLPHDGVEFPWHQDSTHRRYGQREWRDVNGRGSYVQIVTAIDDGTGENGPIRLIPGSAKLGHLEPLRDGELPRDCFDPCRAVSAVLPAGSILLFGPYTIHASSPNRSSCPRRVFINGFAYPGANSRIYPGEGAGRLVRA